MGGEWLSGERFCCECVRKNEMHASSFGVGNLLIFSDLRSLARVWHADCIGTDDYSTNG
jgi:hypothetical protein